jgi:hypothetical protein
MHRKRYIKQDARTGYIKQDARTSYIKQDATVKMNRTKCLE